MKTKKYPWAINLVIVLAAGIVIGIILAWSHPFPLSSTAQAQSTRGGNDRSSTKSPTAAWYPRTEKVARDEMFVVALGTGMPTPITRAQKSSAWYPIKSLRWHRLTRRKRGEQVFPGRYFLNRRDHLASAIGV